MKSRLLPVGLMVAAFCFCLPAFVPASRAGTLEEDAHQAELLIHDGKLAEAAALYTSLLERAPTDPHYLARYGLLLYVQGRAEADPTRQRELYKKSRSHALQAQKAGSDDPLMPQLIASVSEEGDDLSRQKFSENKEANDAIQQGETAFAQHNYAAAAVHYQRALELDPRLYEAALYMGDVCQQEHRYAEAGQWYARAIGINPDRETAYRYWANCLSWDGKVDEAGEKYINAIIAEPNNRLALKGLNDWAELKELKLQNPAASLPRVNLTIGKDAVTWTQGEQKDPLVIAYAQARAAAATKMLAAQGKYLPGLADELAGLQALLAEAARLDPNAANVDAGLRRSAAELQRIADDGLLEAFIVFVRVDPQSAVKEYAAYRSANRDKLRLLLRRHVLGLPK